MSKQQIKTRLRTYVATDHARLATETKKKLACRAEDFRKAERPAVQPGLLANDCRTSFHKSNQTHNKSKETEEGEGGARTSYPTQKGLTSPGMRKKLHPVSPLLPTFSLRTRDLGSGKQRCKNWK